MKLKILILFFFTNLALAAPTLTLTTTKNSYEFGELPSLEAQWVADATTNTYVVRYDAGQDIDYSLVIEPLDKNSGYEAYARRGCGTIGLEDEMFFKLNNQTDATLITATDSYMSAFWNGMGWLASGKYKLTLVYNPMHTGIQQKPKYVSEEIWSNLLGKGNPNFTLSSNSIEIEVLPTPAAIQEKLDLFAKIEPGMPADKVKEILGDPTQIEKPGPAYHYWTYQLTAEAKLEILVADLDKENNWSVMRKNKAVKLTRTF